MASFNMDAPVKSDEVNEYPITYRIRVSALNVRFAPGAEFDSFFVLTEQDQVQGKEPVDGWCEINCYGFRGFVYADYIADINKETVYSIGTFKTVAYCPCRKCCGKSDGITRTGTVATQGRTIAVDPSVIPLGSIVIIDGHEYIAEDTGVYGRTIDVFFNSHSAAWDYGMKYKEVYIKERSK